MNKTYTVEFFSRKPLFSRRQYYWRIRHSNGNIIADSSEGYYNRQDCRDAYNRLKRGIWDGNVEEVDLDKK